MTDRSYLLSQKMSDDTRFCFDSTGSKITLFIQNSQHYFVVLNIILPGSIKYKPYNVVMDMMYYSQF